MEVSTARLLVTRSVMVSPSRQRKVGPGRLAELLNLVGRTGANLQEVQHNRLFGAVGYDDVEVQLDLETTNKKHQDEIVEALKAGGFRFTSMD